MFVRINKFGEFEIVLGYVKRLISTELQVVDHVEANNNQVILKNYNSGDDITIEFDTDLGDLPEDKRIEFYNILEDGCIYNKKITINLFNRDYYRTPFNAKTRYGDHAILEDFDGKSLLDR